MADTLVVLSNIRRSFSFLWEEFGFGLTELKPRADHLNHGYEACVENESCKLVFMSEGAWLDEIYIRTKEPPYFGRGLKRLTRLLTGRKPKSFYLVKAEVHEIFDSIAEYIQPTLHEMLELAKTPTLFDERLKELEAAARSNQITVEMIRAERARLHALGLDSSLGAAMANLQKRDKHE
jgi:hypothetical protein